MADNDEQGKLFIEFMLTATELVDPQHRTKIPEYIDSLKESFLVPGERVEMNGYNFLPGTVLDTINYGFNNYEWKSSDILVAAFAKTGTTWVTSILHHIVARKDPELLKKYLDISAFFSYLEFGPVSKYEIVENLSMERKLFGTHLPASFVNLKELRKKGTKVICVFRNPKDQAVSWYNFVMGFPIARAENWKHLFPVDEKEFFDLYLTGEQRAGAKEGEGYLEVLREWYEHKDDENVLFVMYEKIKKDPRGEIRKLAEFIGESPTEEELDWILEKTSFSSMKKKAETRMENGGIVRMFRKGQIGDWKNHLTVAQSELIDQKVKEVLSDTDIKFIYE